MKLLFQVTHALIKKNFSEKSFRIFKQTLKLIAFLFFKGKKYLFIIYDKVIESINKRTSLKLEIFSK